MIRLRETGATTEGLTAFELLPALAEQKSLSVADTGAGGCHTVLYWPGSSQPSDSAFCLRRALPRRCCPQFTGRERAFLRGHGIACVPLLLRETRALEMDRSSSSWVLAGVNVAGTAVITTTNDHVGPSERQGARYDKKVVHTVKLARSGSFSPCQLTHLLRCCLASVRLTICASTASRCSNSVAPTT